MFQLFATNPDLLSKIRPKTYRGIRDLVKPVEDRNFVEVLAGAPKRTIAMAHRRVIEAGA